MQEPLSPTELHLVFGGELEDPTSIAFRDVASIEFVGAFTDRAAAQAAWRARAQATVDNALMRFFILPAHEALNRSGAVKDWAGARFLSPATD